MLVKQAYFGLFLIYLVASCVDVFDPGLPQPPDLLLAFAIAVLATGFIVRPAIHKDLVFFGVLFVGYVALVNLFWYMQYQTDRFWLAPLYYAYNFGAVMVVVSLIREFRERFVTACLIAIAVAIVFEIAALYVLPRPGIRSIGTFNNPNQLGYWALLLGCCWLVLRRDQKLGLTDFAALCGAGYLTVASLSKAAMLSFALLLLMALTTQRLARPAKLMFLALAFAATSTVVLDSAAIGRFLSVGFVERAADRIDDIGDQGDDSLAGRGYDRIWRHPEHLILGAGEGALWRFSKFGIRTLEMHSTLGTVLFSYGIVGFSLFVMLLAVVFRGAPLAFMLYSLPIWAYGMTHQGLRTTMLWIFLGMAFGMSHYARSPRRQQTVVAPEAFGPDPASVRGQALRPSGARSAGP